VYSESGGVTVVPVSHGRTVGRQRGLRGNPHRQAAGGRVVWRETVRQPRGRSLAQLVHWKYVSLRSHIGLPHDTVVQQVTDSPFVFPVFNYNFFKLLYKNKLSL